MTTLWLPNNQDSFKYLLANSLQWVDNSWSEPFTTFYNLFVEPVSPVSRQVVPAVPGLQLSQPTWPESLPWVSWYPTLEESSRDEAGEQAAGSVPT